MSDCRCPQFWNLCASNGLKNIHKYEWTSHVAKLVTLMQHVSSSALCSLLPRLPLNSAVHACVQKIKDLTKSHKASTVHASAAGGGVESKEVVAAGSSASQEEAALHLPKERRYVCVFDIDNTITGTQRGTERLWRLLQIWLPVLCQATRRPGASCSRPWSRSLCAPPLLSSTPQGARCR